MLAREWERDEVAKYSGTGSEFCTKVVRRRIKNNILLSNADHLAINVWSVMKLIEWRLGGNLCEIYSTSAWNNNNTNMPATGNSSIIIAMNCAEKFMQTRLFFFVSGEEERMKPDFFYFCPSLALFCLTREILTGNRSRRIYF